MSTGAIGVYSSHVAECMPLLLLVLCNMWRAGVSTLVHCTKPNLLVIRQGVAMGLSGFHQGRYGGPSVVWWGQSEFCWGSSGIQRGSIHQVFLEEVRLGLRQVGHSVVHCNSKNFRATI